MSYRYLNNNEIQNRHEWPAREKTCIRKEPISLLSNVQLVGYIYIYIAKKSKIYHDDKI